MLRGSHPSRRTLLCAVALLATAPLASRAAQPALAQPERAAQPDADARQPEPAAQPQAAAPPPASAPSRTAALPPAAARSDAPGCLAGGAGFLRARVRGSLTLDLAWHDAELHCDGGPRPGDRGIRLSFAGPLQSDGRRLRLVFGVGGVHEGEAGGALPTNVTLIFEGEERLYATRGDDKCTVDSLRQERFGDLGGTHRTYRVSARGFCTGPATRLGRDERIVVTSFDFAGRLDLDDEDHRESPPPR